MDAYGCYRFVYSSSATVYGIPPQIPIPETSPLSAESCYGRTKIVCEGVLHDLCLCMSCCINTSSQQAKAITARPDTWRAISLRYFKSVTLF